MAQAGRLEKLYSTYRDRAAFYIVYIREAHPSDGTRPNRRVVIKDPKSLEERTTVAATCAKALSFTIPMLIDDLDDGVAKAYGAHPDRLYIVGKDGRVAYQGGPGPRGFRPDEMEKSLREYLAAR